MIDETKSRSNKELLEHASMFNFGDYRLVKDHKGWYIKKYNAAYDREFEYMEPYAMHFPLKDEHYFESVYDALEVVKELIK